MKKQVLIMLSYIAEIDDSILTGKGQQEKNGKISKKNEIWDLAKLSRPIQH